MPFSGQSYDHETRCMLSAVFDNAWEHLQLLHFQTAQPQNVTEARAELAKRIAEAYEKGEREPQTLELVALRAFNRWLKEV